MSNKGYKQLIEETIRKKIFTKTIDQAAEEYVKGVASQDFKAGAIDRFGGRMTVLDSYPIIKEAFRAGAKWFEERKIRII